jgi:RNA polymerase-binding transcription factor DksA
MSEADQAQAREIREWEMINNRSVQQTKYAPGDAGYGPEECDECGAQMIPERRAWGFTICIACKQAEEKIN